MYLTPHDTAKYLKISTSTLAKLRVYGGGPAYCRLGGKAIRYRQADLDAYMASRIAASTAEYKNGIAR